MTQDMTIARLAEAGGVGVETIRFYQRRGLMPVTKSGSTSYRTYDQSHVDRLRFIRSAQNAGFTLEEIGELLELDGTRERKRVREMARERLAALDAKIDELKQSRASLGRLLDACETKGGGCCPIVEAFQPPRRKA
jgi:MerR family mercuric resistance operon transcriptional regulator